MIDPIVVQYSIAFPSIAPGAPVVPVSDYFIPSDASYRADLNVDALDAAVPDDNDFGGRENANRSAQVLAPLMKTLKYYAAQGKSPVRVQSVDVVGILQAGQWIFFLPSSGVVMRCNTDLSFGSQTFEALPEYFTLVRDLVNDGDTTTVVPWQIPFCFLSSSLDMSEPPRQAFWNMYVKTAEVI